MAKTVHKKHSKASGSGFPAQARRALMALAAGDHAARLDLGEDPVLAEAFNRLAVTVAILDQIESPLAREGRDLAEAEDRNALVRDLARAVGAGELSMRYQPKLNLRTKTIDGLEALARWEHPTRGWVPPAEFIWLAERSGEIEPLTRFTLKRTIEEQGQLIAAGCAQSIHVNISGKLISDEPFVEWAIDTVLAAPGGIGFEITETAVIGDPERALRHVRRIADAGIPISIDDYGSGLSSLVYLKQFPAKELKIDRAFICELTASQRDPLIVRSTIDLAHALEMEVTAEGVEDDMTLALLQVMGCDRIQGYHLAKPMIMADLIHFVREYALNAQHGKPESLLRRILFN